MTTASDDFNRANETPIASPWASVSAVGDVVGGANLASNALWSGGGAVRLSYYTGTWADDQTVDAVVGSVSAGTNYALVGARLTAGGNGYIAETDGATATLYRLTAGVFTSIKSVSTTFTNGDKLGIRTAGSTIHFRKNDADIDSVTDSNHASGNPGAGGFASATIDNWSAADVGATPSLAQAAFRFYNDDGSESAATAAAGQNVNVSLDPDGKIRLRIGVQASGDPLASALQLEWRRVGDSVWNRTEV